MSLWPIIVLVGMMLTTALVIVLFAPDKQGASELLSVLIATLSAFLAGLLVRMRPGGDRNAGGSSEDQDSSTENDVESK